MWPSIANFVVTIFRLNVGTFPEEEKKEFYNVFIQKPPSREQMIEIQKQVQMELEKMAEEMSVQLADVDGYLKLFKSYGVKGQVAKGTSSKKGSSKNRTLPTWPGR